MLLTLICTFALSLVSATTSMAAENLALDTYTCADFLHDTSQPGIGSNVLKSMMMIAWATGYASGVQRDFVRADASAFMLIAGTVGNACRKDPTRKVPEVVATLIQLAATARAPVGATDTGDVGSTAAQQSQNWTWCNNDNGVVSLDLQIGGCTGIIHSGRATEMDLAVAFHIRGLAYNTEKQPKLAIADFDQAIQLNPAFLIAFLDRSVVHGELKEYDEGAADGTEAIRLDASNAIAYSERCWDRANLGQLKDALDDCNKSLQLDPNSAATLDSLGFIFLKRGAYDEAISDYDSALKADPKLATSLYGRGVAKRAKGDLSGADADIAAAKATQADVADQFAGYGVH